MTERGASDDDTDDDTAGTDRDSGMVHEHITPDAGTAEYDLLEILADLEGKEIDEFPSLYTQVNHFVESLFDDPPAPESQMEIRFSYAGYRITITQRGEVKLVPVKETAD